jgi:hypothetical protein
MHHLCFSRSLALWLQHRVHSALVQLLLDVFIALDFFKEDCPLPLVHQVLDRVPCMFPFEKGLDVI